MGTTENQQLMFSENGFRNNSPHTAGLNNSHESSGGMDEQDDEIAHPLSYGFPKSQHCQRFEDFARDTSEPLDVLISDIEMPCGDGYELMKR